MHSADDNDSGLWFAKVGDMEGLQLAVAQGFDPTVITDKHGTNAVQWAAGAGHYGVVQWLLEGCSVQACAFRWGW